MKVKISARCFLILFMLLSSHSFYTSTAEAKSAKEINKEVKVALNRFRKELPQAVELLNKARGVLIFPQVFKASIGIGGEYGEGALQVRGKSVGYYSTASASVGFQLGAETKMVVYLFMAKKAYSKFRTSDGWKAGVDASVAIPEKGVGGSFDSNTLNKPVLVFIFGNSGLMYNLTIEEADFRNSNVKIYKCFKNSRNFATFVLSFGLKTKDSTSFARSSKFRSAFFSSK